jgi:hypothetical protein
MEKQAQHHRPRPSERPIVESAVSLAVEILARNRRLDPNIWQEKAPKAFWRRRIWTLVIRKLLAEGMIEPSWRGRGAWKAKTIQGDEQ